MRRFVALILMLVIPLQFAWAAALGVHGHAKQEVAAAGHHTHEHHHGDHGSTHHDHHSTCDAGNPDHEDGPHCHSHPVFSSLIAEPSLALAEAAPDDPVLSPPSGFLSRVPPLLDRPPLAHA
jgi:hypothetical protein